MRARSLAAGIIVACVALLAADAVRAADREVFVTARPRRYAPVWYDDLPAWKQAHPLTGGTWVVGIADRQPSEAAAKEAALANAKRCLAVTADKAAKIEFVEEDTYLRVFGPDADTPKWYYLAVLFRVSTGPPSPREAYQENIAFGRQALADNRLMDARAYFLTAEEIRAGQPDLPPIAELKQVEERIKTGQDLIAAAERAARRRDKDQAEVAFQRAADYADKNGMQASAVFARQRVAEVKKGEFDRWIVLVRENMQYKPDDGGAKVTDASDRVRTSLESMLAERGLGVASLDVAGLKADATMADIVRKAREHNVSYLLYGTVQSRFVTDKPGMPYSDMIMPTARGAGSIELVDLRSGDVVWKQRLAANGFGHTGEQSACENALDQVAAQAKKLLENDADKLGL